MMPIDITDWCYLILTHGDVCSLLTTFLTGHLDINVSVTVLTPTHLSIIYNAHQQETIKSLV